jgi:hypothetical protein
MKSLLELIKALYGPKAISSTIGTRTNVIRLPSGKLQKYLSKDLNIEAASDEAAKNAYNEMKELIPEVAKMNDGERLVFEGNLRRLKNKLEDSGLIQKENVSSGITALESKVEELRQKGKELEKVTGKKATLTDVLNDLGASQQSMSRLYDEGLVRAAARQILINDIKAGKIKNITVSEAINMGEPLDPFRQIYGEGALEQLDSLIPNLRGLKTEMEAEKFARSKFKFEPDENRLPGSVSIEEGRKAEQEFGINKPAKVSDFKAEATKRTSIDDLIDEYNANQDRLRLSDEEGGTAIGYEEFQKIQKRNEDIAKALEDKGISSKVEEAPQAEIIPFRKKPTEPEGKADGGRIGYAQGTPAMGLDYLTGMEPSKGYADSGRIELRFGSGKKIINKLTKKSDKKIKKPTKEDYEDYGEILNDSENTVVQGTETFEELDALVKKQKDYEASMFQQYKMGKLDPVAGENSENRMKFLQKKLEEASMTKDRRLISPDELNELDELERTFSKKEMTKGTSLEEEMNMVLNQYDKSMFVKNEQGMVDVTNPENVRKMALLLQRDHPEIYKKLEEGTQTNVLEDFDVTGRKPNAKGGLNYLMGL